MHRHDAIDIELQAIDIVGKHDRPCHRRIGHRRVCGRQVEHVCIDEDLLLRQLPHHEPVGVRQSFDHVNLERPRRILEDALVAGDPFDDGLLSRLGQ